jgi:hypothetical protein
MALELEHGDIGAVVSLAERIGRLDAVVTVLLERGVDVPAAAAGFLDGYKFWTAR